MRNKISRAHDSRLRRPAGFFAGRPSLCRQIFIHANRTGARKNSLIDILGVFLEKPVGTGFLAAFLEPAEAGFGLDFLRYMGVQD
jgi:hypothetical protein